MRRTMLLPAVKKKTPMISETTIQEPTEEFLPDEDSIFTIWLNSQDDEPVTPEINIPLAPRLDNAQKQLNAPLIRFQPGRL